MIHQIPTHRQPKEKQEANKTWEASSMPAHPVPKADCSLPPLLRSLNSMRTLAYLILVLATGSAPAQDIAVPINGGLLGDWRRSNLLDYFLALPHAVLPQSPLQRAQAYKDGAIKYVHQNPNKPNTPLFGFVTWETDEAMYKLDGSGDIEVEYWFKLWIRQKGPGNKVGPAIKYDLKYSAKGWAFRRKPPVPQKIN